MKKKEEEGEKRVGKMQGQKANCLHSQVPLLDPQLGHMQPGDSGQILSLQPLHLCNAVRVSQPAVTLVCFQDQKSLCGKFYISGHAGHMEALQAVFRGWMRLGRPGPQDVGNENVPQMVNRAVGSPCRDVEPAGLTICGSASPRIDPSGGGASIDPGTHPR